MVVGFLRIRKSARNGKSRKRLVEKEPVPCRVLHQGRGVKEERYNNPKTAYRDSRPGVGGGMG